MFCFQCVWTKCKSRDLSTLIWILFFWFFQNLFHILFFILLLQVCIIIKHALSRAFGINFKVQLVNYWKFLWFFRQNSIFNIFIWYHLQNYNVIKCIGPFIYSIHVQNVDLIFWTLNRIPVISGHYMKLCILSL